jgi:hypothetical protein
MKITKEQAPPPPREYVLRLDYTDLHDLYHFMLKVSGGPFGIRTDTIEWEFFQALKEHA